MNGCSSGKEATDDVSKDSELYQCSICKLHFETKILADQCDDWCLNYKSCNMEIAGQSIEAKKKRQPNK